MGLFDKLAKQGLSSLKDKLEEATGVDIDAAVDKLAQAAKESVQTADETAPQASAQTAAAAPPADVRAHFAAILGGEFAGYEVKTEVAPAALGAALTPAKPYDFVLYKNGRAAGTVMLTPHNRDRNAAFKNARAAAQQAGVPFINFYTHYPNEKSYVVTRIKSFLR